MTAPLTEVGMVFRDRTARWWSVVLGALALLTVVLVLWLVTRSDAAGIPDEFAERATLPECGRAEMGVDGGARGEAVDCFDAALAAGDGAELVVEVSTAEGDPVIEYHRALPDGGVEIFTDSREDSFGRRGWSYARCPDARRFLAPGECEYRDL